MIKIPENILTALTCTICNGYLSSKPVVVKNGRQICGKCYRILPQSEKNQCIKQVSFEAIATSLVFPCRYHKMGCSYTFVWDTGHEHESECLKRYFTFPDVVGTSEQDSNYETLDNRNEPCSASNTTLHTNLSEEDRNLIDLSGEKETSSTKTGISLAVYENVYERLTPSLNAPPKQCHNCSNVIRGKTFSCLFGHLTCTNCKGEMCLVCTTTLEGTNKVACKNVSRGCKVKLQPGDVAHHRDNCEFNIINCPMEKCTIKDVLSSLKVHLLHTHGDKVYENNEITKIMTTNDQTLVLLCHDGGVFKFAYYYYATNVEIFVTYLGPCKKAIEYYFEVSVMANKKVTTKKRECANWNNCMLASGVTFDKKELINNGERKFNFELNLRILHVK